MHLDNGFIDFESITSNTAHYNNTEITSTCFYDVTSINPILVQS